MPRTHLTQLYTSPYKCFELKDTTRKSTTETVVEINNKTAIEEPMYQFYLPEADIETLLPPSNTTESTWMSYFSNLVHLRS